MPNSNPLQVGQRFGNGRFVLVRALGRGGMGEVWLAQDERLHEDVALKFLPPEIRGDAVALDDLRRETVRSHKLTHPNIVRIHDLHEEPDGTAFIIMEYVDGPTLASLRLEQPGRVFAWDFLKPLVEQLCAALDYAHGEKVIHRDLKPANMMVDSRGRLKLADFGIAAVASDSMSRVSAQGPTSGTLLYMSPQQLAGKRAQPADDIYALGATLYELLTSQPPFVSGDITHQILHEMPEPIAERLAALEIENAVPGDVSAMIMACLAKEREQRPQSAAAVAGWIGLEVARKPSFQTLNQDAVPEGPESSSEVETEAPTIGGEGTHLSNCLQGKSLFILIVDIALILAVAIAVGIVTPKFKQAFEGTLGNGQRLPSLTWFFLQASTFGYRIMFAAICFVVVGHFANRNQQLRQRIGIGIALAMLVFAVLYAVSMCLPFLGLMEAAQKGGFQRTAASPSVPWDQGGLVAVTSPVTPGQTTEFRLGQRWTNSLGMIFVSVPGTRVLFSIWDTRVQDFEAFVKETDYNATAGMLSMRSDGWNARGDSWQHPGFTQGPTYPVVGVSWEDAHAFCAWLTRKEQNNGVLLQDQNYRLPTDSEWSAAVGPGKYPWGDQWPPPPGAGNYAGEEAADDNWMTSGKVISGYSDGYVRTSPVGSFDANQFGLYDMGGNVWQWCEDWYRKEMNSPEIRQGVDTANDDGGGMKFHVLRGGSWKSGGILLAMQSDYRSRTGPHMRATDTSFRCVLVAPAGNQ